MMTGQDAALLRAKARKFMDFAAYHKGETAECLRALARRLLARAAVLDTVSAADRA